MLKSDRRRKFFDSHPRRCYCTGGRAAVEIDHAPARTAFPDRPGVGDIRSNRAVARHEFAFARPASTNGHPQTERTRWTAASGGTKRIALILLGTGSITFEGKNSRGLIGGTRAACDRATYCN